mmetsp:Transcript_60899/g.189144  ORF Transcript_60899/g.189144 Transcript_60899/m.189144 type:complete len:244 (-) Transcript_60899:442-1173(-)
MAEHPKPKVQEPLVEPRSPRLREEPDEPLGPQPLGLQRTPQAGGSLEKRRDWQPEPEDEQLVVQRGRSRGPRSAGCGTRLQGEPSVQPREARSQELLGELRKSKSMPLLAPEPPPGRHREPRAQRALGRRPQAQVEEGEEVLEQPPRSLEQEVRKPQPPVRLPEPQVGQAQGEPPRAKELVPYEVFWERAAVALARHGSDSDPEAPEAPLEWVIEQLGGHAANGRLGELLDVFYRQELDAVLH